MRTSRRLTQALLALSALVVMGTAAMAADPGLTFPALSEVSDQKAGSLLIYNFYSSIPAQPNKQNTRINITNTSTTSGVFVHLFFVEGSSCFVSDRYICLTENQTLTFLASEQDPGTTGYIVAIAVSVFTGCPIHYNHLIGDLYAKLDPGHQFNLGAEAFAAIAPIPALCDANSVTAVINFDGINYNRLPRVLAVSNIQSLLNGNDTRVIINQIKGSLVAGSSGTQSLFGILYDDQERAQSWNSTVGCQRFTRLNDDFPRTSPRFVVVIPDGQTGWMKFWIASGEFGILGAVINFNPNAGIAAGAFNGGHNLHKLTLTPPSANTAYTIPIFAPSC